MADVLARCQPIENPRANINALSVPPCLRGKTLNPESHEMRSYRSFKHKDATFRICCREFKAVMEAIVHQRAALERYIASHAAFGEAFTPLDLHANAPEVAARMATAARMIGVGPMAAVAGTMAQLAAEAGLAAGADEAIVENGGDIYLSSPHEVIVGLFAGDSPLSDKLAFAVQPADMPLAICSSSSRMGHSDSLGDCDLSTAIACSASLADAAATEAANRVTKLDDLDPTLEAIGRIDGIRGLLLVKGDKIGVIGSIPRLVRNRDAELVAKVTKHERS